MERHAGLFLTLLCLACEVTSPGAMKMDWIQNNFWIYMGILVLVLVGLVAVLFVVRKNQDN